MFPDYFQEGDFPGQEKIDENTSWLSDNQVTLQDVGKIMENLDMMKAQGPDTVSNWLLRECSKNLADKIVCSITECSPAASKVYH